MNLIPQTVVSQQKKTYTQVIVQTFVLTSLLFCADGAIGQENFSEAIKSINYKNDILSLIVKDSLGFTKNYSGKLSIIKPTKLRNHFYVSLRDAGQVSILMKDTNILFIDLKRTPHTEGNFDLVDPSVNSFNRVRKFYPDINGTRYTASIKEESFDRFDLDLTGRSFTTSVSTGTISQHATTMAVLIGGAGNSSPLALGAADHAQLTSSDFSNLMPDDNDIFIHNSISVQNHSYGVGIENYYGAEALAYDQQALDIPRLLHIFSSGNIGATKPTSGSYANLPMANLTGTFKQSKNALVVTAIDSSLTVNRINSRGPAFDGRLKPELAAYGPGGTSEAAALTTSTVILIQEKYQSLHDALPDIAMTKAILIASADDIGASGIDYVTGYGNLNAYQALSIIENNQVMEVTLNKQDNIVQTINIPFGTRQLRLAVSWIDPPAIINASQTLINDIDSWLDDGTSRFNPWVLSTFPNLDSLQAIAKRKTDHVNNIEFITIDNPAAGAYSLNLTCGDLQGGQQKVSIAYYLDTGPEFNWTFPVSTDILNAAESKLLGWTVHTNSIGNLYYSVNGGVWQFIQSVNLNKKFKWAPPDLLCKAQLKMEFNGQDYLSDEFIISPELKINTEFVCSDSVRLSWNKITAADYYEVYSMGSQYLEKFKSTPDTAVVIHNPGNIYFAVNPIIEATKALRSVTVDYTQHGSFCYLNLFTVQRISAESVKVELTLGSLYQVQQVNILREVDHSTLNLTSIVPNQLTVSYTDQNLVPGHSYYKAEISLSNGGKIFTDPIEMVIEEKGKAVIWPNPVTDNDYLRIISNGTGEFRLINQLGQILFTKNLNLLEDELDLQGLEPGLYFYQLIYGNAVTTTGRIIKR